MAPNSRYPLQSFYHISTTLNMTKRIFASIVGAMSSSLELFNQNRKFQLIKTLKNVKPR